MAARLIDSNNHVPDVSPDDHWGDAANLDTYGDVPVGVLPPKRKVVEAAVVKSADWNDEGLRIGSSAPQRQDDPASGDLEIHEISGNVLRLQSESATTAKSERQVVFQERPPKSELLAVWEGKEVELGSSQKKSIRWLITAGIGVVAMIVTSLLLLPIINHSNAVVPRPSDLLLTLDRGEVSVAGVDALNEMVPLQSQAEQIYRAFASATLADDFLPLIRDAKSLEALIRKTPHIAKVSKAWLPSEDCNWNVFDSAGIPCGVLEGTLPDQSSFSACFVMKSKRLMLDWKATVGYCTAVYDDLVVSHGDGSEIRGWIIPTDYYTAIFPEADFQSYQLLSPDKQNTLWCYARKGSPENRHLAPLFPQSAIIEAPNEPAKITISLEHNRSGSLLNQWSIGKVLHKEWISP
ncbi:MAG: hypothetical protein WCS43_13580 [Verrucomicrobiota bacterium]